MNSHNIFLLANGLLAAQRHFEEATRLSVREWAQLRVKHLDLLPSDASREFKFDDLTDDDKGMIFVSEDWEETWSYGGNEQHCGRTIVVPFAFFDDPQPFRDEAEKLVENRKLRQANIKEQNRKAEIARLEAQLAKARQAG